MNRKKAYPLYETTVFRDFRVMVEQSAENFPDRPAISYKKNPRDKETQSVTYLQAKNDIRDLGTEEIALGLRDKKVAIVGGASCGWVYTYFSLMAIGAVTVPLDKEMPAPDLAATIERASCAAIFYGAEIAGKLDYLKENTKAERAGASTTNPVSTSVNYHIIRFADILLWRAEIAINEGDLATALNYINKVRARAANYYVAAESGITNGTYVLDDKVNGKTGVDAAANYRIGLYPSFSSAAEAREALEREMRIEFGMEGRRWFDIARWGKVADVLNAYAASESKYLGKFVNTYSPSWVNFPIPASEINTAMGRFVQTANWK